MGNGLLRRSPEIAPDMLSQLTVLAVCGISPRIYLELLRTEGFSVRVVKLGKLRLVRRDEFVAWLESHGSSRSTTVDDEEEVVPDVPDDDPDAIDDLIRGLGFRREASSAQRGKVAASRAR